MTFPSFVSKKTGSALAVDADGGVTVDSISEAFTTPTGYTGEEIRFSASWGDLVQADGLPLFERFVQERMKSDERTKATPVVVLTSSREERCEATLGANSYIVKPVDFEKFAEAVGELGLYGLLLNEPPRA